MGRLKIQASPINIPAFPLICLWLLLTGQAYGQDVEPRRWTPLPVGTNVIGAGYLDSSGDVSFDPVLKVEDATVDVNTLALSYAHAFSLFGRSARVEAIVPRQHATWKGQLDGTRASLTREGFADPIFRLSVNLYGAPAAGIEDFMKRAATQPVTTMIGAALTVSTPFGEYFDDKLLNLGQNRYFFRPQVGVLHTRGNWSYELTGSIYFYTDNDEFFSGNTLAQETVYAMQAHIIRVFKPGLWASLSAAGGWNGETSINGTPSNNNKNDYLAAISVGLPVTRSQGIKLIYLRSRTHRFTGADLRTLGVAWSTRF